MCSKLKGLDFSFLFIININIIIIIIIRILTDCYIKPMFLTAIEFSFQQKEKGTK